MKDHENMLSQIECIQEWQTKVKEEINKTEKMEEKEFTDLLEEGRGYEIDLPELKMLEAFQEMKERWQKVALKVIQ